MSENKTDGVDTSTKLFSNLNTMFKTEIRDIELKPSNIANVLSRAMKVVEISELKGEQQKFVAKALVRKAVVTMEDGDRKTLLLNMLENDVLEDMVETIILATRGELQINEVLQQVRSRCCGLF
tara:strand:+ start:54 stop:425 length:372 start_codon:yes stop_codon:yes gene_type:complete